MNVKKKFLLTILEENTPTFIIPIYQRYYCWTKIQCKRLLDDLLQLVNLLKTNDKYSHFFGTMIFQRYEDVDSWDVVDGQQRLVTISILLLAIDNYLKKYINSDSILSDSSELKTKYLIVPKLEEHTHTDNIKIQFTLEKDKLSYSQLFESTKVDDLLINWDINKNYIFFWNEISELSKSSLKDLYLAIKKLEIVAIRLTSRDNPQLIYETLNSTQVKLTEAEKIKNYIFMNADINIKKKLFKKYWLKIEKNVEQQQTKNKINNDKRYSLSNFFRIFLTIRENTTVNKSNVFLNFKKNFKPEKLSNTCIEKLLKDILYFSELYNQLIYPNRTNEFCYQITIINKLKSFAIYPLLLLLLDDYNEKKLNHDDLLEIFKLLESYIVRTLVCNQKKSTNFNKLFFSWNKHIKDTNYNWSNQYFEHFKKNIIHKTLDIGDFNFPNDDTFKKLLINTSIGTNANLARFLLGEIENFNNKEKLSLDDHITLEHIMPQTLNMEWKSDLGDNFENTHENYLNNLGNLTLTGYNPEMNNNSFAKKCETYLTSHFFISKSIVKFRNQKWDEEVIKKRAILLCSFALKIWKYPNENYPNSNNTSLFFH